MEKTNWYVSQNVHQDNDTMLFTKIVKSENLKMDKDRTIAHVEGITLEEAERNAKIIAAAPDMLEVLNQYINHAIIDRKVAENQLSYFMGRFRTVLGKHQL